jgi:N utilization substance protein B
MSRRSRARQVVLQLLFQEDLNSSGDLDWHGFLTGRLKGQSDLVEFAGALFTGVRENLVGLDLSIQKATHNWKLARLSATDRNVLRLAAFEILHFGTPAKVAIDEAIELARRFGNADSAPFVNGVLDRLYRDHAQPTLVSQPSATGPEIHSECSELRK